MTSTDLTSMLPLLLLCCMLPLMMRGGGGGGGGQSGVSTQMDIWFTGYTSQEAFDSVVKAGDEARQKAEEEAKTKKSRLPSLFSRGKKERYTVEQAIPPHLYRIADAQDGIMYFEFSDAEGGGTQVKATYGDRTKTVVQNLKTKMPPRKLSASTVVVCPSCGRPKQPEWQFCPYDGAKYG